MIEVKKHYWMALLVCLIAKPVTGAETALTAGIWGTYQYLPDNEVNQNSGGEITGEALILYLDGNAMEEGKWLYSAEMRFGPGSFTDPHNNSTGDQFALHKAWVGWEWDKNTIVRVGKSQVPFGWKTINFWPGDILLAGFGDQMDVGVKVTGLHQRYRYDVAYYLADDWGDTSTDTVDDNAHWGSSTTYRKVQTFVGNAGWQVVPNHLMGVSVQAGQLQDLSGPVERPTSGSHRAAVLYYEGVIDDWFAKASYIRQSRALPDAYQVAAGVPAVVENDRLATEVGYNYGLWSFYLDASAAFPHTDGSSADTITAFAPGMKYDYGPGWVYLEFLTQDGFIDRNGQVFEGDFNAVYLSLDFYL